ncbi:beta-N-acetylhexosaminidase [uncultured Gammaproteobacteria bacterium]
MSFARSSETDFSPSSQAVSEPERSVAASPPLRAVVFGCAGTVLSDQERAFFRRTNPLGFILFRRNCDSPEQVRALVVDLRTTIGREDAPVLIDQEGGRVARLRPPNWPEHPSARTFGELAGRNRAAGREAAWINARLLAETLHELGINVDCAPVCDVPVPGAHDIIGDRAFAEDPQVVAELARASCEGLLAGGVLPVIKHIPGHGRARSDSHDELPVVNSSFGSLNKSDFPPFRALADLPLGMVAHVVYAAIDHEQPASTSAKVISQVIRRDLGFNGLLFSDDLSMKALDGTLAERATAVLEAGCDIVLHCNGNAEEMAEIAAVTPELTGPSLARWLYAQGFTRTPHPVNTVELRARLEALLG